MTCEYKTGISLLAMGRPRLFDLDAAIGSALEVFWKQGYAATTPAELLEAIGVGKGSFYNAFESKHAVSIIEKETTEDFVLTIAQLCL